LRRDPETVSKVGCVRGVEAYVDGADEVLGSSHDVDENHTKEDSHDPCTDEALDRLLGRELNELSAAKGDTTDVGEDVVGNDEGGREEEPNHALEDVVHDEVGLDHNEVQSHVRPRKVCELELVVSGLEGSDKGDEAYTQLASPSWSYRHE
jgi:hypothetical protein